MPDGLRGGQETTQDGGQNWSGRGGCEAGAKVFNEQTARQSARGHEEDREGRPESKGRDSRGTPGGMASGRRPDPEPAVQPRGRDLTEPFGSTCAMPSEISRTANCSHTKESPKNNPHYFLIAELMLPSVLLATCTPTYSKIQKGKKKCKELCNS